MSLRSDHNRLLQDYEALKLQFISTELELAETFSRLALESQDSEKVERNSQNARRAYEAAIKQLNDEPNASLVESQEIDEKRQCVEELLSNLKNERRKSSCKALE